MDRGGPSPTETVDPALLEELAKHDAAMPGLDAGDKVMAQWHLDRIEILKKIIAQVQSPEEKLNFYKLVVHDLAEAYKTGLYPQGSALFDSLQKQGGKLGSFATYRRILAEFDLEADKPGGTFRRCRRRWSRS